MCTLDHAPNEDKTLTISNQADIFLSTLDRAQVGLGQEQQQYGIDWISRN